MLTIQSRYSFINFHNFNLLECTPFLGLILPIWWFYNKYKISCIVLLGNPSVFHFDYQPSLVKHIIELLVLFIFIFKSTFMINDFYFRWFHFFWLSVLNRIINFIIIKFVYKKYKNKMIFLNLYLLKINQLIN